jgi:hypothetical protein
MALANHGHHWNQYSFDTFKTKKTSSKEHLSLIFSKFCASLYGVRQMVEHQPKKCDGSKTNPTVFICHTQSHGRHEPYRRR